MRHQPSQSTTIGSGQRQRRRGSDQGFGLQLLAGLRCVMRHHLGHEFMLAEFVADFLLVQFLFLLELLFEFEFLLPQQTGQSLDTSACESAEGAGQHAGNGFADQRRGDSGKAFQKPRRAAQQLAKELLSLLELELAFELRLGFAFEFRFQLSFEFLRLAAAAQQAAKARHQRSEELLAALAFQFGLVLELLFTFEFILAFGLELLCGPEFVLEFRFHLRFQITIHSSLHFRSRHGATVGSIYRLLHMQLAGGVERYAHAAVRQIACIRELIPGRSNVVAHSRDNCVYPNPCRHSAI